MTNILFSLQSTPYGAVVYDLIGDDGAQTLFQIGRTSGQITIRNDLASSSTNKYTVCPLLLFLRGLNWIEATFYTETALLKCPISVFLYCIYHTFIFF